VARGRAELEPRRSALMAEQYIAGREMTVGIVDGVALPVIEILPATAFYDFEAKYYRDDTRYVLDPEMPAGVLRDMRDATEAIYREIGLRDAARADFMIDERGAWFLEINSAPGMTTHSLVPKAARHRGTDMPELCGGFVRRALGRREALRTARALAEQT
jgi:D-alanine-D-alanine ligase